MPDAPPLQIISGDASPEEVAAITAAIATVLAEREAAARAAGESADDAISAWTRASRLTARRAGLARGPWRLSGRIGRRARA
jgi:Acyl-CoA carboxylase epsilon subunit